MPDIGTVAGLQRQLNKLRKMAIISNIDLLILLQATQSIQRRTSRKKKVVKVCSEFFGCVIRVLLLFAKSSAMAIFVLVFSFEFLVSNIPYLFV